jgi:lysophospholipase L1-like esterase
VSLIKSACLVLSFVTASALGAVAQAPGAPGTSSNFSLRDGDRVTFYGDSITEQREYTEFVEEYLLTRFPHWKVTFRNAGVGGDKVSGGWAGPVDLRIDRDVLAARPDVVTIMLGMNDGYYRPSQPGIVSTYAGGYRHIVDAIQKSMPQTRITLIQPSPYDDVTREPLYAGGYNGVMLKFSESVAQLAREKHLGLADFNTPVTTFLKTLNEKSPDLAPQLVPDRVHPSEGGHWIMAEALLKQWNAPSLVSSVAIAATSKSGAEARNARVTDLRRVKGKLDWTQLDNALPLPFPPAEVSPVLALTVKLSDLVAALDQQTLQIRGLPAGNYDLLIDNRKIATFPSDDLSMGVNLATMETPMLEQSRLVAADTEKKNAIEADRFKIISASVTAEASRTAAALAQALPLAEARQRADAEPKPHHFEIVPHL